VEIAAIAREAGHRTKIAVLSRIAGLNPKGACIGPMGARVRAVMAELHGEKIDIVDFSEDPASFVASALSPARVSSVEVVDPVARAARVVVPDYQLSLAIGKEGQNARLAARLTGWRIDIRGDTSSGVAVDDTADELGGDDPGKGEPSADVPVADGSGVDDQGAPEGRLGVPGDSRAPGRSEDSGRTGGRNRAVSARTSTR
jgi:N utilization substance protein A